MDYKIDENKKTLILFLIIPLSLGLLSYLLTKEGISNYNNLLKHLNILIRKQQHLAILVLLVLVVFDSPFVRPNYKRISIFVKL